MKRDDLDRPTGPHLHLHLASAPSVFGYFPPTRLWVDLLRMRQIMAGTQVDTTANGPEAQEPPTRERAGVLCVGRDSAEDSAEDESLRLSGGRREPVQD